MAWRSRQVDDSSLAGLGFSFTPVNLCHVTAPKGHSAGQGPPGSGGADRAPAAKAVAFNLRKRQPGAAYGSPEAQQAAAGDGRQCQPAEAGTARGTTLAQLPASSSLAQLKQASLRRRAVAAAATELPPPPLQLRPLSVPPPAGPTPALLARERESRAAEPAGLEVSSPGADSQRTQLLQDVDGRSAQLLKDMESMLAGCSAAVLDEPAPSSSPQQHILLGRPVLAVPPPAQEAAARGAPAAPSDAARLDKSAAKALPCATCTVAAGAGCIAAHPLAPQSGSVGAPATEECAPAAAQWTDAAAGGPSPPESLEQALQCLGLLASQWGAEASSRAAAAEGVAGQHWVRLRAVQLAVAAKVAGSAEAELVPLVRRLRQVRLHLEFHQASGGLGKAKNHVQSL